MNNLTFSDFVVLMILGVLPILALLVFFIKLWIEVLGIRKERKKTLNNPTNP